MWRNSLIDLSCARQTLILRDIGLLLPTSPSSYSSTMKNFQVTVQSNAETFQLCDCLNFLLPRVHSTLSSMVNHHTIGELGVTGTQSGILCMLSSGKLRLASELARECGIDASSTTRLIDRLEKRRLVTRQRGGRDRRTAHLTLTPEGQAVAARMPAFCTVIMDRALDGFTAHEKRSLTDMLRRILENSEDLA